MKSELDISKKSMRRGELFGLKWKDIDFENGYLSIVRTSQYIGNKTLITKEPKTKSSHRKMKLSNDIIKMLNSFVNGFWFE